MARFRSNDGDGVQRSAGQYDYDDPRRYTTQMGYDGERSGGGVSSRRSRILTELGRRGREAAESAGQSGYQQPYYQQGAYQQGGYPPQQPQRESGFARRRRRRAERRAMRRASGRPSHRGRNVLLAILAAIVALYLVVCLPIDRSIAFTADESQGLSQELSLHVPLTPYYVLALGSDAREGDTVSRTDTMILCRVDPIAGKLTMVSIPRDTMVQIDGHGTQKINAAYAFGGAAGAVHAVTQLTGVGISHVALVHFDGIETLVNALGGVTVNVPVDVNDPGYTGLVMPAGTYQMDGHTAMLFSRVRHGFANGDYQRQADQRILIEAIMQKALSSPASLPVVGRSMGGLLSTTMRCYGIIPLLGRFTVGTPTVYSASLPSSAQMVGGVSYVVVDQAAAANMMDVVNSGGDPATVANGQQ